MVRLESKSERGKEREQKEREQQPEVRELKNVSRRTRFKESKGKTLPG